MGGWVQVNHAICGMIEVVHGRIPWVQLYTSQVCQMDKRGLIVTKDVLNIPLGRFRINGRALRKRGYVFLIFMIKDWCIERKVMLIGILLIKQF